MNAMSVAASIGNARKSTHLTLKLLSLDGIVKEGGTMLTEKENDRIKVFFLSSFKQEKCLINGERELALSLLT